MSHSSISNSNRNSGTSRLTWGLSAFVICYHLINIFSVFTDPARGLEWESEKMPHLKSPEGSRGDAASEFLAGLGTVLRYQLGEFTELAYRNLDNPLVAYFLRTEIRFHYESRGKELQEKLRPQLIAFVKQLQSRGVRVLLLPLPTKFSIERSHYSHKIPSSSVYHYDPEFRTKENPEFSYSTFLDLPHGASIDLLTPFKKHFENQIGLFLPWDFHLSSYGIALTAKIAIEKLTGNQVQLKPSGIIEEKRNGLILGYLRLPTWFMDRRSEFRWKEPLYSLEEKVPKKWEGNFYYLGTSQSRRLQERGINLPTLIEKQLGVTLHTHLIDGNALIFPLSTFAETGVTLKKGDTLIWEIPVGNTRFLPDSFPTL